MSPPTHLECLRCGAHQPVAELPEGCPACRAAGLPSSVVPRYDLSGVGDPRAAWAGRPPGVWRYRELLPLPAAGAVSLAEGGTPLVELPRLAAAAGVRRLWLKDERRNPSGSSKDRFNTVAVSRAAAAGATTVALSSSGNGATSAAAYAARAGLACVVVASRHLAEGWRAAVTALGARTVWTETSAERFPVVAAGAAHEGWYPLTNYLQPPIGSNWWGVEGYKTLAYEIAEELGWRCPDWVAAPVSRGDGLLGMWRGFVEMHELGLVPALPRLLAAERFPSLSTALARGLDQPPAVEGCETSRAVSIGNRVATYGALHVVRASGGTAVACDDGQMREMVYRAGTEGVFLELSSAAGLCAVAVARADGVIGPGDVVIAVGTATGLTDPAALSSG